MNQQPKTAHAGPNMFSRLVAAVTGRGLTGKGEGLNAAQGLTQSFYLDGVLARDPEHGYKAPHALRGTPKRLPRRRGVRKHVLKGVRP